MILSQIFIGFAVFLLAIFLTSALLPGFKREKKYAAMASTMVRTEKEAARARQGEMQKYLAYQLIPGLQKRMNGRNLFSKEIRIMHELLDTKRTFEEMLAAKIVYSMYTALPTLILPLITSQTAFFAAYPVAVVVMFINEIRGIRSRFQAMQREIQKDLPLLMDKMMIALETGKPFIGVFLELERSTQGRMNFLLKRLNGNFNSMRPEEAISIFAKETTIPVMVQFATAVKIGINNSYTEAKEHFEDIKEEILELRKISMEQLTSNKPKKVAMLYGLLIGCAVAAVAISFFEIFKQIDSF